MRKSKSLRVNRRLDVLLLDMAYGLTGPGIEQDRVVYCVARIEHHFEQTKKNAPPIGGAFWAVEA